MFKCKNCDWEGEELSKHPVSLHDDKCPVCGDEVCGAGAAKKVKFDINNDGKVDAKDAELAAKVLANARYSRKKKK